MKKDLIVVLLMLGLSGLNVQAEDMPRVAGYTLDVIYVEQAPGIEAQADVTFAEPSFSSPRLIFYLHGELRVDEVKADGKQVDVDHEFVLLYKVFDEAESYLWDANVAEYAVGGTL